MQSLHIKDEGALERWLTFWLSLHDLGKFSEAFQSQRPDLFQELRGRLPNAGKSYSLRHDSLGMLFWRDVLAELAEEDDWFGPRTDLLMDGLDCWMRAVTGHHGQPPKCDAGEDWTQHFDRQQDRAAIFAFATQMRVLFVDDAVAAIPSALGAERFRKASVELSWWIAGLTVLADWLGSNTEFFGYRADPDHPLALANYWEYASGQAEKALDAAGVLPIGCRGTISFTELFPGIAAPSALQDWVATVEISTGPQLYMLEDVTGAGKTEAAAMLAHRLMAAGCADGFFIGLPTMATANAMYGRIAQVYAKLFAEHASLALAHGQRNLVEAFAASVVPSGPADDDPRQADDTATARCTSWLADHNKRALLSPAGVGTLDQALLAVLHSRHQSLRLLGLFRKVLIVDEVHACDAYMQGVLETLLEFHARVGGSAIILSATLPQRMKQALLDAFAKGCHSTAPAIAAQPYPLATQWHSAVPAVLVEKALSARSQVHRTLGVRYVSDKAEVTGAIEAALAAGKCVCWMRNTVADAVAAYGQFEDRRPSDRLILFHARFALRDRLRIEEHVLALFGARSESSVRTGRLLIATQVVEQSLDVDFDFVVSDLAPIDRLIQRAGRLQRHARDEQGQRLDDPQARDRRGEPCLWVFGPAWMNDPPSDWFKTEFRKASAVYPNHGQLWLTANVLQCGRISMPDDARQLIESVFSESAPIPDGLQSSAQAAEGRSYADASVAQQNTVKLALGYVRSGIDWWSEAKTPTRLGEISVNVLLARWNGEHLRYWVDGAHGCAYSTVRVAERLIARRAEDPNPIREVAIQQFLQTLPNKGQWLVLLPLEETPQGWIGSGWTPPNGSSGEQLLRWKYDPLTGLHQLDENNMQSEEVE